MEITEENFMSHVVGKLLVAVSAIDGKIDFNEIGHHAEVIGQITGVDLAMQQDFYNQVSDGMSVEQVLAWCAPDIQVLSTMPKTTQMAVVGLLTQQAQKDGVEHPNEMALIADIMTACGLA